MESAFDAFVLLMQKWIEHPLVHVPDDLMHEFSAYFDLYQTVRSYHPPNQRFAHNADNFTAHVLANDSSDTESFHTSFESVPPSTACNILIDMHENQPNAVENAISPSITANNLNDLHDNQWNAAEPLTVSSNPTNLSHDFHDSHPDDAGALSSVSENPTSGVVNDLSLDSTVVSSNLRLASSFDAAFVQFLQNSSIHRSISGSSASLVHPTQLNDNETVVPITFRQRVAIPQRKILNRTCKSSSKFDSGAHPVRSRDKSIMNASGYVCETCAAVFPRKQSCVRHQRTHKKTADIKCAFCSRLFRHKQNRNCHERNIHHYDRIKRRSC